MFLNVFTQVIILLILIIAGALLAHFKVLEENSISGITDMVLYTVTPCVIIKSFIRPFDKALLKNLLISFLIAFLVHLGFILMSRLIAVNEKEAQKKVLQFGTIFSNCGYMSLPLQEALLGDIGVFYGASFVAIFNLFIWSYGILLMSGDKKYLTPKKMIINPGIIGISAGLIIFLLSIPVPKVLSEPVSYIASLNTPLPMIIIGYHLYHSNLFAGMKNKQCLISVASRLVIFPAVAVAVMYACKIRGDMLVSCAISCCAPTAAITTMLSSKFSGDTQLSVSMVSISTVLSVITIPLIVALTQIIAY